MINENPLITESRRRLQHLRTLSSTPVREREIIALERTIQTIASRKDDPIVPPKSRVSRARAAIEKDIDDDTEEEAVKPARQTEHVGTHRRVILRRNDKDGEDAEYEQRASEVQKKRLTADIKGALGIGHRGMS